MSRSVNPANVGLSTQNNGDIETISRDREPPPPYSPPANNAVDHQPQQPTSIIHQTIIVQAPLKNTPMFYMCPRCQDRVLTKVEYVSSKGTHMLAGFICGLTLWCCLCCLAALPYYFQTFKKAQHFCPNCNELLGTYSKI